MITSGGLVPVVIYHTCIIDMTLHMHAMQWVHTYNDSVKHSGMIDTPVMITRDDIIRVITILLNNNPL